jgi:DNA polymerase-3 subunit gamma/tau
VTLIAQSADGSMRDALSLLDQLIAFGAGKAGEADARAMLGTVSRDQVVRIVELLASADTAALLRCAQALEEFAPDYAQVLDELAALLVRVALRQAVDDYEGDELYPPELLERLARSLAPEDTQLFYQTAITGKRDLPLAPEPRRGFEMTLLRMIAFRPADEAAPARAPAAGATRAAVPVTGTGPTAAGAGSPAESAPPAGATDPWAAIVSQLELSGAARQLASHCVFLGRQGGVVRLGLDPRTQQLRTAATEDKLTQALSRHFTESVRLEFQSAGAPGAETPALLARRASEAELAAARRAFEEDPLVQGLRERFGATVLPDTVRPVK